MITIETSGSKSTKSRSKIDWLNNFSTRFRAPFLRLNTWYQPVHIYAAVHITYGRVKAGGGEGGGVQGGVQAGGGQLQVYLQLWDGGDWFLTVGQLISKDWG